MRATRALIGAFGAGTSLAIAGSAMLLIVSSVVAFNGWPNDLAGTAAPATAALQRVAASSASPAEVPSVAVPDARADGARPASRTGRPYAAAPVAPVVAGEVAAAPRAPSAGTQPPAGEAAGTPAAVVTPNPVRETVPGTADTVREATEAAAGAVAPVSPSGGSALESVGAAGADTVEQVGALLP